MLRAAAAPERFLDRGFARFVSRPGVLRRGRASRSGVKVELGVALPLDLTKFLAALDGGSLVDVTARPTLASLNTLMPALWRTPGTTSASMATAVRVVALFANAVPFGETHEGELLAYFLADAPARGIVAAIAPDTFTARLVCRGAAELAVMCSLLAS